MRLRWPTGYASIWDQATRRKDFWINLRLENDLSKKDRAKKALQWSSAASQPWSEIISQAVITADLAGFLANKSDLTVFAPNDRAFIRLANDLGYEGSDETGAFDAIVQTLTLLGNGDPLPLLTTRSRWNAFFCELRQPSSVNTVFGENIVPRYNRIVRDPLPLLNNVLLYHVTPMIMSLTQVVDGEDIATLFSNASIQPDARKLV